jgi:hypothetical protein
MGRGGTLESSGTVTQESHHRQHLSELLSPVRVRTIECIRIRDPQEVIDHQGQYSQACRCKVKKSFPRRCSEVDVQRKYLSFSLPRKSYKQTPKTTNYRWNHVQKSSNLFDGYREPDTRECFPFVSTWLPEQSRTTPAPVSREWESKTRRRGRLSR